MTNPSQPGDAATAAVPSVDFIRALVAEDQKTGKNGGRVQTRFPPEPNGYLHIGHAKSICLNFGIAQEFGGKCNLRFDDTNPAKEDVEYVDSIKEDIRWLGFNWAGQELYASDYFEQLYGWAEHLITTGKAYVDSLEPDKIRQYRGTLTEPGKPSPDRERPPHESLELFRRMRAGEFADGALVLRAKIDMASPNLNLRDPILYRIRRAHHHRTGDKWVIYPMYDWAHGQSDAIEGITHSICTLEFENHRPLYDWFLDNIPTPCHPRQLEFARLNLTYTVMSKRKLLRLVQEGQVTGWDDPRMPTLTGLRRRGFTPESIRSFAERISVAKRDSIVDVALLEHCVREHLNEIAPRVMAVIRPLRVVIENFPEGQTEQFELPVNPGRPEDGTRKVPFTRVLYIEHDDFREDPPKKYFRLSPGKEVRLRGGYFIKCVGVDKDPSTGQIIGLRCTYDPETRGGVAPDGRKVKVTIHWVSAEHAIDAEVRLYDRLFTDPDPGAEREGVEFTSLLNPASLEVLKGCKIEHTAAQAAPESRWQFERLGYFCADRRDSRPGALVFNRTVSLKDEWAKLDAKDLVGRQSSNGK